MRANRGLWLACLSVLVLGLVALRAVGEPAGSLPKVPLGLPPVPVPADNPMTPEKVELGKMLYFDTRLSKDGTVSCATCHDPKMAWAEHEPTSKGIGGQIGAAELAHRDQRGLRHVAVLGRPGRHPRRAGPRPDREPHRNGPQARRDDRRPLEDRRVYRTIPEGLWHAGHQGGRGQGHRRLRADGPQRQLALRPLQGRRQTAR